MTARKGKIMNEIKLLLGIVNDMRSLADSLQRIAESI